LGKFTNKIKFIYFDLGGVFFHWRIGVKRLAEKFRRSYEDFDAVRVKYEDLICRGKMTPEQFWEKYVEEFNLNVEPSFNFLDSWVSLFEPIPKTHQLAWELSNKYRLGALTNAYPGIYDLQIKKEMVPKIDFQPKIISCEIGIVKPEKAIYKLATEKAQTPKEEIFFIDDVQENVTSAVEFGWQAIWFEENNPSRSIREIRESLGIRDYRGRRN